MANKKELRKEKRKNNFLEQGNIYNYLKEETLQTIMAVVFFVLALFLILSAFGKGGVVGQKSFDILSFLFGIGYYLLPVMLFILCVSFFRSLRTKPALTHSIGGILFFLSSLALVNITEPAKGGIIGEFPVQVAEAVFGHAGWENMYGYIFLAV